MTTIPENQRYKSSGVVDICFLMDATGSMQPCIDAIKESIRKFVHLLTDADANGGVIIKDWRICVWGYRDFTYDPKYGVAALVRNPFTRDIAGVEAQLGALEAKGGGDEPESLLDALYALATMGNTDEGAEPRDDQWRSRRDAARCIVVVTDASFHPTLETVPGATLDDVIRLIVQERLRLNILAPEHSCYSKLGTTDKSNYEPIEVQDGDAVKSVSAALTNQESLDKIIEMLAKSISQSAPVEAL